MCRFFALVILVISPVLAFRTGAGTCFATVEHVNAMSFSFYNDAFGEEVAFLAANVSSYIPNSAVSLNVSGGPLNYLKGILLYATTGNATDSKVGTFTNLTSKYHIANCGEGDTTVTHSNRDPVPLPSFQWTAPPPNTGTVNFHAVISIGPQGDTTLWTILQPLTLTEESSSVAIASSTGMIVVDSSSAQPDAFSTLLPTVASTGVSDVSSSASYVHASTAAGVSSSTGPSSGSLPPTPSSAISIYYKLNQGRFIQQILLSLFLFSVIMMSQI
jgi:hypothetical protein